MNGVPLYRSKNGTYRYAGTALHSKLKNKITRHESLKLNPKTTGPSVPAENLPNHYMVITNEPRYTNRDTHERILKFADPQMKKILL